MATRKSGIQRAQEVFGTNTALAAACGVSRQNIDNWVNWGYVPVHACHLVANMTGIRVEELNPLHDWAGVRKALSI